MRSRPRVVVAVLALAGLTALACSGGGDDDDARTRRSTSSSSSTSLIDYSTVVLAGVGGSTTSTIREKGDAALVGKVVGPDGPVEAAVVRIERLVGNQVRRTDVPTDVDGKWELRDVPGGRYRVRAFLAPELAQAEPELFFLPAREERSLDLRVERYDGLAVVGAVAPDPPRLRRAFNLVVQLESRTVDAEGVIRATVVKGRDVELFVSGRAALTSDAFQRTNAKGQATYELFCNDDGKVRPTLRVYGVSPTTTTTEEEEPSEEGEESTSSSSSSSTTSSSLPDFGFDYVELSVAIPDCLDPATTTTTADPTASTKSTTTTSG